MDKTFINIGNVVQSSEWSRIKYHPFVTKRNLTKITKTSSKRIDNIATFEVCVNMDNNTLQIREADGIPDQLDVISYSLSINNTKKNYLIGSTVLKKPLIKEQLSMENFDKKYLKEYDKVLTIESFITKYRILLQENMGLITNAISIYDEDNNIKKIAFIITITLNNSTDVAHSYQTCLDEMDEMFLSKSYKKNKGYIFTKSFYSMFNYNKYELNGVKTMYDNSIPYYSKDDFLSLYYAKKIFEQITYTIDQKSGYGISIFPNYDGLIIEEVEKLLFRNKNLFDFNMVCNEIENLIINRTQRNRKEKTTIPHLLKFDVYYRYKSKGVSQNMLRLNGIRYVQLLKIKKYVEDSYKIVYKKETIPEKFIIAILFALYKDNQEKSDKYITTIFKTLQNIYQEKYSVPQQADFCLLDNSQYIARKGDDKIFRETWNNSFNIYKFLKTMENKDFISELENNPSYQLGVELAKFESGWKNDRENLKKTIEQFSGNISKRVHSIQDVYNYYINLVERLIRNDAYYGEHNELLILLNTKMEFNTNYFIMGFFTEKNTFRKKPEEITKENI